jgi:hypothetical protein
MQSRWLTLVRKNHAVEHATISVLGRNLDKYGQFGGSSNSSGYYIYGPATKENVLQASAEAVDRLNLGEHQLAISPFCGTNFLLGGAMATLTTGAILGKKNRLNKIPEAIGLSVLALVGAFRLGSIAQRKWTTLAEIGNLTIDSIEEINEGLYKVNTNIN